MGWSFTHRDKGTSNLDYFRAEFGEGYELLDGATVGGVFYGALQFTGANGKPKVTAVVILTRWNPNDRDGFNFGTKDMTESWGPSDSRCPDRILDMLSPVEDLFEQGDDSYKWATEWRERCRAYNWRIGLVKRGTTILHAGSRYTAVNLRRNLFRGEYGTLYRFPHWRSVNFEVVA